jgi:hypothetical protein
MSPGFDHETEVKLDIDGYFESTGVNAGRFAYV